MMMFYMAHNTQTDDIGRVEHAAPVLLDMDTVMHVEDAAFGKVINGVSAIDATEVVSFEDRKTERGVSLVSSLAARFHAKFLGEGAEVKILSEPVRVHFGVKVPMFSPAFSLPADCGVALRSAKSFVPRLTLKLNLAAIGMMSALVFWNTQAAASVLVNRESSEDAAAPALARYLDASSLCFGNSHVSMLSHAGKIEKSVNCGDTPPAMPRAIRSQAVQEWTEGSTTRPRSPERTVKAHERTPRKGRDSLDLRVIVRSIGLNADAITIRPYSGKLEALAKFQIRKPVMQALRNDAVKVYDKAAYAQFYLTKLRASPLNGTGSTITLSTTGTASGTNTVALGANHVKSIVDTMKERNIPGYVGDDYMAIAWPSTLRTFKNTLETLHQYTAAGIQLIFNAEIGRYENVRFTEQTNVSHGITSTGSSGTAWSTGLSDWCFFFGEDTVVEGIAIPEEIRAKIPTDYGRSKGVAYYSINGFGLVHNQTDATESRVVMWDSLA